MSKKREIDKEEVDLFRDAMRGTKPLVHTKITPKRIPSKKRPVLSENTKNPEPFNFHHDDNFPEVTGSDLLEFHRGGLQHKVLRNLRRGQYNVQATLDMHGMRVVEAKETLSYFLLDCVKNGIRHVLIIHGKGHGTLKPVLKNKLNQWLRQIEYVLAFCSATQKDGRSGAVYVLLKGEKSA